MNFSFPLCNLMRVWYLETRGDKTFCIHKDKVRKQAKSQHLTLHVYLMSPSWLSRICSEFQMSNSKSAWNWLLFFFELFSKEGDCINPIQKQGYFVFGPVFAKFCDYLMQISSLNFPAHTRLGNWPWNLAVIENPHRPSRLIRLSIISITWWEQCAVATW